MRNLWLPKISHLFREPTVAVVIRTRRGDRSGQHSGSRGRHLIRTVAEGRLRGSVLRSLMDGRAPLGTGRHGHGFVSARPHPREVGRRCRAYVIAFAAVKTIAVAVERLRTEITGVVTVVAVVVHWHIGLRGASHTLAES